MPDWTYQTVFRPLLFRLGPRRGRNLALGSMGLLSRLPFGRRVIQLMGHMKPDQRLAIEREGVRFPSPVGLGCRLDPHVAATSAFAEFGFGYLEIGPVNDRHDAKEGALHLDASHETLVMESPHASLALSDAQHHLRRIGPLRVPVVARIEPTSADEARELLVGLTASVDGFVVPIESWEAVQHCWDETAGKRALLFVAVNSADWQDGLKQEQCERAARDKTISGVVVEAGTRNGQVHRGKTEFDDALKIVQQVRASVGSDPILIGSVGVHSPADALDYIEAGADMVQVDTGLIFAGPGLPKRINEAILYRQQMVTATPENLPARITGESWFWAFLMGLSMLVGGIAAMLIATTRVVLPYDEAMTGLTREQLSQINDRLLSFMTHDRVTLAGTMIAVGIQYIALAWWGIRHGTHWAYVSVVVSAMTGFFCFFSFLGFGYFDPFHAFVTAILFQFLLLTMHSPLPLRRVSEALSLRNDRRWKTGQWGQLLFVIHGSVLIVAGLTISGVGMTTVFVPEDLHFMHTSEEELFAHPQLVPLVAHDRATFGGMLIACGIATLLPSLWGFQRGQAWLWWSLMLAGSVAYLATILVHWVVGYDSLKHLLPAYGGLIWLWAGGIASFQFLAARDPTLNQEWTERLART